MTTKEMNRYRSRLVDLTTKYVNLSSDGLTELSELAKQVGVSPRDIHSATPAAQIIQEIHQALQTASMINMAETAARSYWIALVASLIALLSAAAAWVAVFVQIVGNMKQLYL